MEGPLRWRGWWLLVGLLAGAASIEGQEACRVVDVTGRGIRVCSAGTGPTTVVLAAGAGQASRSWADMVNALASEARVVTFDRPGLGGSDPAIAPRTPSRIADELASVLAELELDGPIVLVGHSMGGLHVLHLAASQPDRVAAVVLLDTPPPGFEQDRLTLLTLVEREERTRLLTTGAANAPEVIGLERRGAADPDEWEVPDFPRGLPLVVVVADAQYFGDLGSNQAHRDLWASSSRHWLTLSDRSEYVVATGSGHMVHHDRRQLVVDIVLGCVRSPERCGGP